MKAKVNIPKRGNSNPPLKNLPPSALLEEQTKAMEQRLKDLKTVMAEQQAKREALGSGSGSRWQSANQNQPIKNYAEVVIKSKKDLPMTKPTSKDMPKSTAGPAGVKSSRDKPSREKLDPIANSLTATLGSTGNISQKNKENESQKDFFKGAVVPTPTSMGNSAAKTGQKSQRSAPTQQEDEKTAENNINRALSKQKETNEVEKFLDEIGLPQYTERFKENGFDDLETLMDAQTKHFVDMKIPAGHQIKLAKRIEQLRQSSRPAEKIIPPTQKVSSTTESQINMDQIKSNSVAPKRTEYVQLEEPTKEQATGDDRTGGELLQGEYNEEESRKAFQEAVNEWRSGKAQPQPTGSATGGKRARPKDSRDKKVRFAEPEKEGKGKDDSDETDYISSKAPIKKVEPKEMNDEKKSFFFSGGNSWNQPELPSQKETSTNMSPRDGQASQKAKVSCWNCYRLVADDEAKSVGKKMFCSDECVKNFKELNSTKCMKKGCGKTFLKEEGMMREGRWYCNEKCAPTMEEILMEEQRLMKKIEKEENLTGYKAGGGAEESSERSDSRTGNEESQEMGADEGPMEIDLSVDVTSKKQVLTLAELEEKYKNMSQIAEKAQGGENELEDSLN